MIRNRLSVLLAERELKITRVAKDTGISRNTITSTAQNDTEMIRLETVNVLCKYLNVTPCEFFEYVPIDISFSPFMTPLEYRINRNDYSIEFNKANFELYMDISGSSHLETVELNFSLNLENTIYNLVSFDFRKISVVVDFNVEKEKQIFLNSINSELDASFRKVIFHDLTLAIKTAIQDELTKDLRNLIKETFLSPFTDDSLINDLEKSVDDFELEIKSDVFKPF